MADPRAALAEIQARADAATEGTWQWFGPHAYPYLATRENGRVFVMKFARSGMAGGQPMMRDEEGKLRYAKDIPVFEVCPDARSVDDDRVYRDDITGLRSPDARFIAAARTDVPRLTKSLNDVLELHKPERGWTTERCRDCEQNWPCLTYRAITAALAGES